MKFLPWLKQAIRFRAASPNRVTLREENTWLTQLWTGGGSSINTGNAHRVGAVLNAVSLRARVVGTLPCHVFERQRDGSRKRMTLLNTSRLLTVRPNPRMSPATFWQTMWHNYDIYGNAYAEIQRDTATGFPVGLVPIPAKLVEVKGSSEDLSALEYHVRLPGARVVLPMRDVLHLKGFCFDGLLGLSKISLAARTVGLANNTETYGENFFANGGLPSGVLSHPGTLGKEAAERLSASWKAAYGTLTASQRVAILEEGMKFDAITVPPADVQFLEVRKFSATQIAALFGVPARLIGANDGPVGWGSVEQETLEWVMFGLQPDIIQCEQEINHKLLDSSDTFYAEFNLDGLLRADIKTRMEANAIAWEHGTLTTDEWRQRENLGPVGDGQGARRFIPMNYTPADRVDDVINARVQKQAAPVSPTR
jgi:HK97 family phage portal protein